MSRFRISPSWLFVLPAVLLGATLERGSGSARSPCPIGATAEIQYGPDEDLERFDVALIREAREADRYDSLCPDRQRRHRGVARRLRARSGGADLARRKRSGEAERIRRGGAAWRAGSTKRASVKPAGRRTDAFERVLRRSARDLTRNSSGHGQGPEEKRRRGESATGTRNVCAFSRPASV
jgi:hypothetical protein